MDDDLKFLLLEVPVALRFSEAEIMKIAAGIGRESGLDADWAPSGPEEAVYEILISSGSYENCINNGVIPRIDLAGSRDDLFTLTVELRATEDESLLDETDTMRPAHWPRDPLSACLSVLMAPVAPVDHGVEIIELREPGNISNHQRVERAKRIAVSRALAKEA